MLARRQIHDGIAAPADGPHQFFDFLGDRAGHSGVADVGIDLDQEIPANDHRLSFRMVDVGRNDGTAGRYLGAHELRCHRVGQRRAKSLPAMASQEAGPVIGFPKTVQSLIFPNGDIFHLGRNNAAPGVVHLGDIGTAARAPWQTHPGKAHPRGFRILLTTLTINRGHDFQVFGITALDDPCVTQPRKTGLQIDRRGGIGIRTRGVIDGNRRILGEPVGGVSRGLHHFTHPDADVWT